MFKILDRLSLTLCVASGFFLSYLITDGDVELPFLFLGALFSFVMRKFFLSGDFIRENLGAGDFASEKTIPDKTKSRVMDVFADTVFGEKIGPMLDSGKAEFNSKEEWFDNKQVIKDESIKEGELFAAANKSEPAAESKEVEDSEPGFVGKFFAENALAKVGGILLFLGVLFLLQLVYAAIGPIGKLIIGFAIGFTIFGAGLFLESRGYNREAKILFGTSILINYLVILSGRYLIEESMLAGRNILSEGITFFLLILNTIFAVLLSMVYVSHALLFLSFVIAYLNPFLIGMKPGNSPYTLMMYSIVVSMGAVIISYFYRNKFQNLSSWLLNVAFIGGNILILVAPFHATDQWVAKLIVTAVFSLACVVGAYRMGHKDSIYQIFAGAYLFLSLLIFAAHNNTETNLGSGMAIIAYSSFLLLSIIATQAYFIIIGTLSFIYLLVAPLFILLVMIFSGIISFVHIPLFLAVTMLVYLSIAIRLSGKLPLIPQYFLNLITGFFILMVSSFISVFSLRSLGAVLSYQQSLLVMTVAIVYLLVSFYLSNRKGLEYLYLLGSLFSIFTIIPVVSRIGDLRVVSIAAVMVIVFANAVCPIFNINILKSKIWNLVLALTTGALFGAGELFYFLNGMAGQSKMTIGFSFVLLAIFYFVLGFIFYHILSKTNTGQKSDYQITSMERGRILDGFYSFAGISLSFFSLAIAYIFSNHPEAIASIWIFESTLLFSFYKRSRDVKIYLAGVLLMIVGIVKMVSLLGIVDRGEYIALVPLMIIFAALAAGLKFLESGGAWRFAHDFFHVVGIVLIGVLFLNIIPSRFGWSFFGTAVFVMILSFFYGWAYTAGIKYFYLFTMGVIFISHVFAIDHILNNLYGFAYLQILQYFATIIFALSAVVFNYLYQKYQMKDAQVSPVLTILNFETVFYLFVITTQYVYYIFDYNIFSITIYWGLIAFAMLNHGIRDDLIKYRTIGLYILLITSVKILVYDIWSGLQDGMTRVFALIVVGGLMIVISTLYSKKYGGQLKGELNLDNLIKQKIKK